MEQQIGMDRATFEDRYLWNIKVFGQIVGLWPEQEKSKKYFARGIAIFCVLILNCAQVAHVIRNFSIDTLADQLPFLSLGLGTFIKHFNYILNEKRVKILLNVVVSDFLEVRPKKEMEILESCINKAIFYGNLYRAAITGAAIAYLSLPAIPRLLDVIAPLNKSRDRVFLIQAYYFVDEQRFYYPILFHMMICTCIIGSVFICCDLNFTHLVQHACALLGISGLIVYLFRVKYVSILSIVLQIS